MYLCISDNKGSFIHSFITCKIGPVTYEVYHPKMKRLKQTYHVNLLEEWKERQEETTGVALLVREVNLEEEEENEQGKPGLPASPVMAHLTPEQAAQLLQIFKEASSLLEDHGGRACYPPERGTTRPQQSYLVPQHPVAKLREEVGEMLKLGVIKPSNSEWCSPVVIILKKDGSLCICTDFRKLNSISEFDAYPMPNIDDLLEKIGAAKYITTLVLCKGYWQVPLEKSSQLYTAFRTPAGLFQFTVMPLGLHGAPATFHRLMDRVLQDCGHCSAAYLDDVVVFSNSWEEHV